MAELPELVKDLALILIVASVVSLLFKRLKQPLVLGYIVAGFLVSPHMPYTMSVMDRADVQTWADIGVIFLLFALGLDFSFKKIIKMGAAPIIAACIIIFCMMLLGIGVGRIFGWGQMDCIFLAGMLAMSSTTIIYKAFDDMGLRQQHFASLVMSVLILEDVLAIVMMVMLSAIASGSNPNGGQMLQSIASIVFFLILWFVVGIFLIPMFLRKVRGVINEETLLILALGLCFLMAVLSTSVGFSSAFGAFVMGSILAETVEADKIIRIVEPVKNLFGAIFFVSVGMLVDPQVLIDYAVPVIAIVLTILIGQCVFGSCGYMLSGQPLKTAIRCGFSMTQIGEFAFIIASLGLSLGVISDFLYPVVVAVSVITTFLTPYMMRAATPTYNFLERHLPERIIVALNHITMGNPSTPTAKSEWKRMLTQMVINTVIYSILSTAVIMLMFNFALPVARHFFGEDSWIGDAVCGALTLLFIAPFLRAMVMKKNHSEEFRVLWKDSRRNRIPLIATIVIRIIIACSFVFYVIYTLSHFTSALVSTLALALVIAMMMSKGLKNSSIRMERLFVRNLRSREIAAQVTGKKRPLYEGHLLDRDVHIADFTVPADSKWSGQTLAALGLRNKFGVLVSSILRASRRLNIPDGKSVIFPGDILRVVGTDAQVTALNSALTTEVYGEDPEFEKREMRLRRIVITPSIPFIGKTLRESGVRDKYGCMVVGMEQGEESLTAMNPDQRFEEGDIIWIVGEEEALKAFE